MGNGIVGLQADGTGVFLLIAIKNSLIDVTLFCKKVKNSIPKISAWKQAKKKVSRVKN